MARKIDLNDLSTWPIPVVLLFCAAIIGIIFFIAKMALVDSIAQEVNGVNSRILAEEKKYKDNQKTLAMLPHITKEVNELEIIRDEAKKFLPTEVSMPSLIDNVYLAARDNGIVFSKFSPEKDINTQYYTIKPISLSADVGYISMSAFIEKVTTLKRIMNVQSVSFKTGRGKSFDKISGENANEPLAMKAQLRTYIFKDDKK